MALSILSYNLPQGFKMSANASNNNTGSNLCTSPPTGDENSSNSSAGRTTINIGKTFSRITMQNVLSESSSNALNISNNSNVNTIVRKIKDIGMYGSVNNAGALSTTMTAARKRTNSEAPAPKADASANENKVAKAKPPNKRAKLTNKDEVVCAKEPKTPTNKAPASTAAKLSKTSTPGAKKPAGTPGRKGLPLPQAVARRNARERNRVKQVNNGFTALRERIPEEIAEAFEAQGNGRGTVKKLSKVETLRMAVEYIRSLERLLGFDFPIGSDRGLKLLQGASSSDDSFTFVKDEFDALSPPLDDSNYDDTLSQYDVDEYLNNTNDFGNQSISQTSTTDARAYEMDLLPSLTTINGLQYVRIPGTNTYQLLTPDVLFMAANAPHSPPTSSLDEESFQALIDTNCMSPVAAAITTSSPHISPASVGSAINAAPATLQQQQQQQRELMPANSGEIVGECVNATRSPSVQQSSPTVHTSLHQRQPQQLPARQPQTPTQGSSNLSPADNNTFLLQTCATPSAANTSADEIDGCYTKEDHNEENVCRSERFVPLATTPTTLTLQMQPPSHAIKQEFNDTLTGFARANDATTTPSPQKSLSAGALIFQQQLQERLLLSHASLATMSPPLERCSSSGTTTTTNMLTTTPTMLYVSNSSTTPTSTTPGLSSSFYDVEQDNSYFESVAHINALKKEYGNALLQAAAQAAEHGNTLSALPDESIIEVMDWWEAHTPKSDGGAALL